MLYFFAGRAYSSSQREETTSIADGAHAQNFSVSDTFIGFNTRSCKRHNEGNG